MNGTEVVRTDKCRLVLAPMADTFLIVRGDKHVYQREAIQDDMKSFSFVNPDTSLVPQIHLALRSAPYVFLCLP